MSVDTISLTARTILCCWCKTGELEVLAPDMLMQLGVHVNEAGVDGFGFLLCLEVEVEERDDFVRGLLVGLGIDAEE